MAGFDPYTWYVLTNFVQDTNDTLTAGPDALDVNSASSIYLAQGGLNPPESQQWQILLVNSTSPHAHILRNRQAGTGAFVTTAWTTRKCGGGNCATVPFLQPFLDEQSLWAFGSWGFSDPTGGAFMYNLGNGSTWHLDVMDGQDEFPELTDRFDTGRKGQHWNVTAVSTFEDSESTIFSALPTSVTALLAQYATQTTSNSITPFTLATGRRLPTITATSAVLSASATSKASETPTGLKSTVSIAVGISVSVAFIALIAIGSFLLYRRHRRKKHSGPAEKVVCSTEDTVTLKQNTFELDNDHVRDIGLTKAELPSTTRLEMGHSRTRSRYELGTGAERYELHS